MLFHRECNATPTEIGLILIIKCSFSLSTEIINYQCLHLISSCSPSSSLLLKEVYTVICFFGNWMVRRNRAAAHVPLMISRCPPHSDFILLDSMRKRCNPVGHQILMVLKQCSRTNYWTTWVHLALNNTPLTFFCIVTHHWMA